MAVQKSLREIQEIAESPCLVCGRAIDSLGDDIRGKQIFENGYVHTWREPNLDDHLAHPHGIETMELPPICFENYEDKYRDFKEAISGMRPDQISTFDRLWKQYQLTPRNKRGELYTVGLRDLCEVEYSDFERNRDKEFWAEKDAEEERRGVTTTESLHA